MGVDTLHAMAEATRARGYAYFGVADHSQSAHYAGGLTVDEIKEQQAEIDRLNRRYAGRFHLLKGIESDILPDGSLDYPDEILREFDFVVASALAGKLPVLVTDEDIRGILHAHTDLRRWVKMKSGKINYQMMQRKRNSRIEWCSVQDHQFCREIRQRDHACVGHGDWIAATHTTQIRLV